ncbi:MAG: ABC transporter permease [Deferrisomatales bacterium]
MTFLKIAFRNVLKNRRRSAITTLAIAFGFMAVCMFKGYTHQAYEKMATAAIFVEVPGHLVVTKKGFFQEGRIFPEEYLFRKEEVDALRAALGRVEEVVWVAQKLELTGLVSNGDVSTIFFADALDPRKERELWTHYRYRRWMSRDLLPADRGDAVFVGPDLMDLLRLREQDNVVLMATTQYGQMNAADATVWGAFPTFLDALNDKYVKMPLSLAQSLYDTDGCDRLCVLCDDPASIPRVRTAIGRAARELGLDLEIRPWDEMSVYYGKAKGYLDVVFLFLFSITALIVVMGTVNTMSMAVYERTREIGTLRAIGLKAGGVLRIFSLEGAILGTFGSVLGVLLTVLGKLAVAAADIRYNPPGVAESVAVEVDILPGVLLGSFAVFVLLSVVSAALPARRAARANIVDALGHI